jgi:hypothetical protein
MPEYVMAMSPKEMTEYLMSEFNDLPDDAKRCIATMMVMIMDHSDFLEDQGLLKNLSLNTTVTKGNCIEINRLSSSWRPLPKNEDSAHRIHHGESIRVLRRRYCKVHFQMA